MCQYVTLLTSDSVKDQSDVQFAADLVIQYNQKQSAFVILHNFQSVPVSFLRVHSALFESMLFSEAWWQHMFPFPVAEGTSGGAAVPRDAQHGPRVGGRADGDASWRRGGAVREAPTWLPRVHAAT